MSYDISFRCQCCGHDSGNFNYTYNLGPMFRWALGESGISGLDGMEASRAVPRLEAAIKKCEADGDLQRFDAPNGWGTGEGALGFLRELLAAAREAGDAWLHVS